MNRLLAVVGPVMFMGCAAHSEAMPSNHREGASAQEAERAYAETLTPAYEPPGGLGAYHARARAGELFGRACRDGHPRACWWALALPRTSSATFAQIEANCAAGHALSCRAKALQRGLSPSELHEGCVAGLVEECLELHLVTRSEEEERFASERACLIARRACDLAAEHYIESEPRDPKRARDLLELACVFGSERPCVVLAAAYVRGELVEPVAGRGRALYDYACGGDKPRAGKACDQGLNTPLVAPRIDI